MNYLEGLNSMQKEAVIHTDGALLILAGAGSGKTKVITTKIAYLIKEKQVYPGNILAITFTNKAANELKNRANKLLDGNIDRVWMGTFHSICIRILRRGIDKIGYTSSFTVYDRDDQKILVRDCVKELNIEKDEYKEAYIIATISNLKTSMTTPDEYINSNYKISKLRKLGEIYALYEKRLKEYNALDFDDLIIKTVKLLEKDDETRDYYQKLFKYILVDEYQDTNTIQYRLIRLLSGFHGNICVVGDADQSIYGWRGADIRNILNFEKDYKDAKSIILEQNYRSTSKILNTANALIKNNEERKEKQLWTENGSGDDVIYTQLSSAEEEATFIYDKIIELKGQGKNNSDFAILYRTNAQSRSFEDCFIKNNLLYKIVGGLKFYDRKEVKDVIAYMKAIVNPADDIAIKRIINVPKRGIGLTTMNEIENIAVKQSKSIREIISSEENIAQFRCSNSIREFSKILSDLEKLSKTNEIVEFIQEVLDKTNYVKELEKEDTIESRSRIENINEFLSVALNYEMKHDEVNIADFLSEIALLSDVDKTDNNSNSVTLMTMHSAKGLEFPVVFVVGLEEGLFPSSRSVDEDGGLEEERRLCYVAFTRAREKLFLSSAVFRITYGMHKLGGISRFVKEVENFIISNFASNQNGSDNSENIIFTNYGFDSSNGSRTISANRYNKKNSSFSAGYKKSVEIKGESAQNNIYIIGDKVSHKKFGEGTIVQISEKDKDRILVITFDGAGIKKLNESIAPLKKI